MNKNKYPISNDNLMYIQKVKPSLPILQLCRLAFFLPKLTRSRNRIAALPFSLRTRTQHQLLTMVRISVLNDTLKVRMRSISTSRGGGGGGTSTMANPKRVFRLFLGFSLTLNPTSRRPYVQRREEGQAPGSGAPRVEGGH